MLNRRRYILWLPSWYPNNLQLYNGDFVQRHAQAVSLFERIEVIHVIRDVEGNVTKDILTEVHEQGNLRETIIYYYQPRNSFNFIGRLFSHRKYKNLYRTAILQLINEKGKPALVHSYIALKAGSIALWLKEKYHIPYVVSEQSTIYLNESHPNLADLPLAFRYLARKIYNNALQVMVVSNYLGDRLRHLYKIAAPVIIPNVVNDTIFNFVNKHTPKQNTFIHISTLNYQKNPEQIIEAVKLIKEKNVDVKIYIVGPRNIDLIELVKRLNLEDNVIFLHERPQSELVSIMKECIGLILFSRYETFGCVLIEAFACGLPVIVSDIPVFHENVSNANGLFAENENATDLADKMFELISGIKTFDATSLSKAALDKYNYEKIGEQISQWYNNILLKD
ncbi:MAG: glycosyltransferase [Candidatus Dadabacteria bacterium]